MKNTTGLFEKLGGGGDGEAICAFQKITIR